MIRGFLINKFRGDPRLFDEGYRLIEATEMKTVSWFPATACLPRMPPSRWRWKQRNSIAVPT